MSWLYCEPKSRTRTVCRCRPPFTSDRFLGAVAVLRLLSLAHTDVLGVLERLALRRDRRGDDHLHVLELGDVVRATDAQRRTPRAGDVLRAVVDAGRPGEDLLERGLGADVDARAPRQVGVGRRHAPVEALAGGLLGAGERGADHHR